MLELRNVDTYYGNIQALRDVSLRVNDGEIVTLNEHEQSFSKFRFFGARAVQFRLNYDSRLKESVTTILTIRAREIITDNDLHFEKK